MMDLILSSTTRIFCFIRSKLKFCGLNKLPITTTAAPTEIETTFPIRRGVVSPVVDIDSWPYNSHVVVVQEQTPAVSIDPNIAAVLLVFFHETVRAIGTTAGPIRMPIARYMYCTLAPNCNKNDESIPIPKPKPIIVNRDTLISSRPVAQGLT